MMNPQLLCIHMDSGRLMRVSLAALSLGIQVKEVRENQQGQTLAALCGLEKENPAPPPASVGQEMLVMAFFPDGLLDQLLKSLRAGGLTVGLKAVLTPYNRMWNCGRLYEELSREAAAFGKR